MLSAWLREVRAAEPLPHFPGLAGGPELPHRLLGAAELPRAAIDAASLLLTAPALAMAPRGDGHPVLVVPGFATTDAATVVLRRYLQFLGYAPERWNLGRKLGAKTVGLHYERLVARLEQVCAKSGGRATVIGWSMGGIMARVVARRRPHMVRQVVTLGAPFTGHPYANRAWRAYERISGHRLCHPVSRRHIEESRQPMPVPATSIYSKSDGVVAWECCLEAEGPCAENVEVRGGHYGLGMNPAALHAIARRLAAPAGRWRRLDHGDHRLANWLYPRSA